MENNKMIKARTILVLDHPFFGVLSLRMKLTEDNNIETACTNGKEIRYNTKFIDSLTLAETVGLMAHEVLHIALGHPWRQDEREHDMWNIAADYTINQQLINVGLSLPAGALLEPKYSNLAAEEIYAILEKEEESKSKSNENNSGKDSDGNSEDGEEDSKKEASNNSKDKTSDPGKCGSFSKPSEDKVEEKELQEDWKAAISQAAKMQHGNLPASIAKQIEELVNPSVPWHVLLRDFVERTAKNDYNFAIPNRRYIQSGFFLPSLISEEIPEIVIAIDTSGSIDSEALNIFAAEASNVLSAYQTTVRVVYCDTKVQKEELFTREDMPLKFSPAGGGGTNFIPVFDYVSNQGLQPACLIYFTDMFGTFPNLAPSYPVMWLTMNENSKAPFGETVVFKKM